MYDLICLSMYWQQRRLFYCKEQSQEVVSDIARLLTILRDCQENNCSPKNFCFRIKILSYLKFCLPGQAMSEAFFLALSMLLNVFPTVLRVLYHSYLHLG